MLTDLDAALFPDDCEVVEIPLHDLRIYLIQKNGTSSLRKKILRNGWNVRRNHDIAGLSQVDVYLRDPVERYISGVNTFVQHQIRDNPTLDRNTCLHFALRYPFLNRHYLPQWHWLLNLSRFLDKDCKIRLHALDNLRSVTDLDHAGVDPMPEQEKTLVASRAKDLELWLLLDQILTGRCGQQLTWSELLEIYQDHPAKPLHIISSRLRSISDALC